MAQWVKALAAKADEFYMCVIAHRCTHMQEKPKCVCITCIYFTNVKYLCGDALNLGSEDTQAPRSSVVIH